MYNSRNQRILSKECHHQDHTLIRLNILLEVGMIHKRKKKKMIIKIF